MFDAAVFMAIPLLSRCLASSSLPVSVSLTCATNMKPMHFTVFLIALADLFFIAVCNQFSNADCV